jgi:hypothetical protein
MTRVLDDAVSSTLATAIRGRPVIFAGESFAPSIDPAGRYGAPDVRILMFDEHHAASRLGPRAIVSPRRVPPNEQSYLWFHPRQQDWALPAINRFDPHGRAIVIAPAGAVLEPGTRLFGRETWGGRSPQAARYEDKVVVDQELLLPEGIPTPISVVFPPHPRGGIDSVVSAFDQVDRGHGAVLAAGAEIGLNGGAMGVAFAATPADLIRLYGPLTRDGDAGLRVAEFVAGVSVGTSAMIFPSSGGGCEVITLPPLEHCIVRGPDGRFRFLGMANSLRPGEVVTRLLSEALVRVGRRIHRETGFTGVVGIDAIIPPSSLLASREGRRPGRPFAAHEVNVRFGAGANWLSRRAGLPWALLNAAVASHAVAWPGGIPGLSPRAIRDAITQEALDHPWVAPISITVKGFRGEGEQTYRLDPSARWQHAPAGAADTVTVRLRRAGPAATNVSAEGFERCVPAANNGIPITALVASLFHQVGEDAAGLGELRALHATFPVGRFLTTPNDSLALRTSAPPEVADPAR